MTVYDVTALGAAGDGVTDDYTVIQSALTLAAPGDTVVLPRKHRVSAPLVLATPNVTLRGVWAPRWAYDTPQSNYVKPFFGSFTGDAVVRVEANGCRIQDLLVDGVNATGPSGVAVDGVEIGGGVHDTLLERVGLYNLTGAGLLALEAAAVVAVDVSANTCRGSGAFVLEVTDSLFTRCLAVANAGCGFVLTNPSDVKLTDCMSVFNDAHGFQATGTNGSLQFANCSTDRNDMAGFAMFCGGASDAHAITLTGCYARRDVQKGFHVGGAAGARHVPVLMSACATHVAKDDAGGGTNGPLYGLVVDYGRAVQLAACSMQGATQGLLETNGAVTRYGPDTLFNTGTGSAAVWDTQSVTRYSAPGGQGKAFVQGGAYKYTGAAGTTSTVAPS